MARSQEQIDPKDLEEYIKKVESMLDDRERGQENTEVHKRGGTANTLAGKLHLPCPYRMNDWSSSWALWHSLSSEADAEAEKHLCDCLAAAKIKKNKMKFANPRTQKKLRRQADIVSALEKNPNMKIEPLARFLGVNKSTISRDPAWIQHRKTRTKDQFPDSIQPRLPDS